jgi:hypothetical protein
MKWIGKKGYCIQEKHNEKDHHYVHLNLKLNQSHSWNHPISSNNEHTNHCSHRTSTREGGRRRVCTIWGAGAGSAANTCTWGGARILFGLERKSVKHRQKSPPPLFFLSPPSPSSLLFFALSELYKLRLEVELGVGLGGTRISCEVWGCTVSSIEGRWTIAAGWCWVSKLKGAGGEALARWVLPVRRWTSGGKRMPWLVGSKCW